MADLKAVGRAVRWTAESFAHQLDQLPADKVTWKPAEGCKSAMQVTAEVIGVMKAQQPLFTGGEFHFQPFPEPESLEEAKRLLAETADEFASALEAAGPEMERVVPSPFGDMWAAHAVLFGMIDLLHHHGQVTYLQSLLGDTEVHADLDSVRRWFSPPQAA